jgi:hypothetical protein
MNKFQLALAFAFGINGFLAMHQSVVYIVPALICATILFFSVNKS